MHAAAMCDSLISNPCEAPQKHAIGKGPPVPGNAQLQPIHPMHLVNNV